MSEFDEVYADVADASYTDGAVSRQGSSKEALERAKIARVLDHALSELRITQRRNDYLVGYTLSERITEELDLIGEPDGGSDEFIGYRRTRLASLSLLLELVESSVARAKEFREVDGLVIEDADE